MALIGEIFDVSNLPSGNSGDFQPLPAGWYTATIGSADVKPTKDGTGQYIAIRYNVTGPTHAGRVVFGNINIRNKSPKAEEIGRQQMGDIMRALGASRISDTDQLVGGSLEIKLAIEKSEQYGESNQIKGFKALPGGFAVPAAATALSTFNGGSAATGAAVPTAKVAPPWAKK